MPVVPKLVRRLATLTNHPVRITQPKQDHPRMTLRLANGAVFQGISVGAHRNVAGEVVFSTGMVGYPEALTDPSYASQILVFSQPLIGNYGVPPPSKDAFGLLKHLESAKIHPAAIVAADIATNHSHWNAHKSLSEWCRSHGVPALTGVDTRALVTALRSHGSTLGAIATSAANANTSPLIDPNERNLVATVSTNSPKTYNDKAPIRIALIDCGVKHNIIRSIAVRGAQVVRLPYNHDILADGPLAYDGIFVSNGPGDPTNCTETVENLKAVMKQHTASPSTTVPIFGICLGHQILGLAAGFKTYKMAFGNRGHNQPVINLTDESCLITSQNHGYAIDDRPGAPCPIGWTTYFRNANDGSNEGIRHTTLPYSSVQFHPEAMGGPLDTEFLFDLFIKDVIAYKSARKPFFSQSKKMPLSVSSPL